MNSQKRCYKSYGCSKVENKNFAYQLEKNKQQLQKVSLEWQVKSKKNKDNAMLECYAFMVKMEI